MGFPPFSFINFGSESVHLTSNMIVPFFVARISLLKIIKILSGKTILPSFVTTPTLSPSPSNARPKSAFVSLTFLIKSVKFSGLPGSG